MARLTDNGIRVSKALNVLFLGIARLFDLDRLSRLAFFSDIYRTLDREFQSRSFSDRDSLLYRHYILTVVYLNCQGAHVGIRYPKLGPSASKERQDERSAAVSDEIHTLARLQTLVLLCAEAKGVDCDVCVEIAKRISHWLGHERQLEYSLVDLALNDYLFWNLTCSAQFVSAMSRAGIVDITSVGGEPRETSFEPLVALALNRELTKCCMNATAYFYRRKHVRWWYEQEYNTAKASQESHGLEPFSMRMSIEALRLESFREVIVGAMDHEPLPEVERGKMIPEIGELISEQISVKIPSELNDFSRTQIEYLLKYSTEGLKNSIFQRDEKFLRLDKIVSMMCGQLFGVAEFVYEPYDKLSRIYRTEEERFDKSRSQSVADELRNNVLDGKFSIRVSQKVIYREFLNVQKLHYAGVRRRWDKLLADESLELSSGPVIKQLVAGNLDFMNLA